MGEGAKTPYRIGLIIPWKKVHRYFFSDVDWYINRYSSFSQEYYRDHFIQEVSENVDSHKSFEIYLIGSTTVEIMIR